MANLILGLSSRLWTCLNMFLAACEYRRWRMTHPIIRLAETFSTSTSMFPPTWFCAKRAWPPTRSFPSSTSRSGLIFLLFFHDKLQSLFCSGWTTIFWRFTRIQWTTCFNVECRWVARYNNYNTKDPFAHTHTFINSNTLSLLSGNSIIVIVRKLLIKYAILMCQEASVVALRFCSLFIKYPDIWIYCISLSPFVLIPHNVLACVYNNTLNINNTHN